MKLIISYLAVVEARLATLAKPSNHFFDLSVENIDSSNYKFAIFTDPQLGKEDKENKGDGTEWDSDVVHIEKMCQEIRQIDDLAFIVVTGDMAHAIPNDEDASNAGSNPPLRPVRDQKIILLSKVRAKTGEKSIA